MGKWRPLIHLGLGYVAGRAAQRVITNRLDPGARPESGGGLMGGGATTTDDIVTIGGSAFAGMQALKRKKYAMVWAGAAVGAATPVLDGLVDRAVDTVGGALAPSNN